MSDASWMQATSSSLLDRRNASRGAACSTRSECLCLYAGVSGRLCSEQPCYRRSLCEGIQPCEWHRQCYLSVESHVSSAETRSDFEVLLSLRKRLRLKLHARFNFRSPVCAKDRRPAAHLSAGFFLSRWCTFSCGLSPVCRALPACCLVSSGHMPLGAVAGMLTARQLERRCRLPASAHVALDDDSKLLSCSPMSDSQKWRPQQSPSCCSHKAGGNRLGFRVAWQLVA